MLKSVLWELSFSMQTDELTDRHGEDNSRLWQFCESAPEKAQCLIITVKQRFPTMQRIFMLYLTTLS
jgi:hypothetical protein